MPQVTQEDIRLSQMLIHESFSTIEERESVREHRLSIDEWRVEIAHEGITSKDLSSFLSSELLSLHSRYTRFFRTHEYL